MRKLECLVKTHDTAHREVLTLEIERTTLLLQNDGTEVLAHLFIFGSFTQVPLLLADLVIMPLRPNEKSWYKLLAFGACRGSRPEIIIYVILCRFLFSFVTVIESYHACLLVQGYTLWSKSIYFLSVTTSLTRHAGGVGSAFSLTDPWTLQLVFKK